MTGIFVGSLDMKPEDPPSEMLLANNLGTLFVPTSEAPGGRLLFLREGILMAQPFDPDARKLVGEPVPVAEGVGLGGSVGYFTASPTGTLVYRSGGGGERQLSWFDRKGNAVGRAGDSGAYNELALSPDSTRVISSRSGGQEDLWLFEFARGSNTRFTFDPSLDRNPIWSPDGSQIAYCSGNNAQNLFRKAANNAGEPELLSKSEGSGSTCPQDWSRDGRFLLYYAESSKTGADLMVLPLTGEAADRKPVPFLATQFNEMQGRFSPDGRWVVYRSNESGRAEVYVRPFSNAQGSTAAGKAPAAAAGKAPAAGKWMISNGGGTQPRWRRDGKEILYFSPDASIMSVPVEASGATFAAGVPTRLFEVPIYPGPAGNITPSWDMTADAQKFLVTTLVGSNTSPPFTVVLNWETALKR